MKIQGKVQFQDLGTGFWAIIGDDGKQWRVLNMPEHLKENGKKVSLTAEKVNESASIFMWGTPIRILND